jgi:hypothetical protein
MKISMTVTVEMFVRGGENQTDEDFENDYSKLEQKLLNGREEFELLLEQFFNRQFPGHKVEINFPT